MSAEIIQHPSSMQHSMRMAEERRAKTLEERMRRLAEIEGRVGKGKRGALFTSSECIDAALEIWKLVREAQDKEDKKNGLGKVTVQKIQEELSSMGVTPRLDRYELNPKRATSADSRKQLSRQRSKIISKYLDVAKAVAALTGENEAALKLRVLAAAGYFSRSQAKGTDELEDIRAVNMSLALRKLAQHVIEKEKLTELFGKMRRVLGQWQIQEESFRDGSMTCLYWPSYQDMDAHCSEAQPLPGVPLLRLLHADIHVPVEVRSAADESWIGATCYNDARLRLFREIRLVIGPTIDQTTLGPMLESRAFIQFITHADSDDKSVHEICPNYTLKPADDHSESIPEGEFQALIDGQWCRMRTLSRIDECEWSMYVRGGDPFAWAPNPTQSERPQMHWWISWNSLNRETVRYWFDRSRYTDGVWPIAPDSGKAFKPIWYSQDLVAHDLERSLVTGALEDALTESVRRLRAAFEKRERAWRQAAEHQTGKLIAGWNISNSIEE